MENYTNTQDQASIPIEGLMLLWQSDNNKVEENSYLFQRDRYYHLMELLHWEANNGGNRSSMNDCFSLEAFDCLNEIFLGFAMNWIHANSQS